LDDMESFVLFLVLFFLMLGSIFFLVSVFPISQGDPVLCMMLI